MKVTFSHLGLINSASIGLGKLTVICGRNNTGKTYLAHSIFGLLNYMRSQYVCDVAKSDIDKLIKDKYLEIPIVLDAKHLTKHLEMCANAFSKTLPDVLSASSERLQNARVSIEISDNDFNNVLVMHQSGGRIGPATILRSVWKRNDGKLIFTIEDVHGEAASEPFDQETIREFIKMRIVDSVRTVLFDSIVPKTFISSSERTGALMFQRELDSSLSMMNGLRSFRHHLQFGRLVSRGNIYSSSYPLAVRQDVDRMRSLPVIMRGVSSLSRKHPELMAMFAQIVGGEYAIDKNGGLHFVIARGKRKIKLDMSECSSTIKSLVGLGFYLQYQAAKNDLFIIDEPEMNLHPANQRLLARLFVRMINCGIKVMITTHSDYIMKELNTMITLNQKVRRIGKIVKSEGLNKKDLLSCDDIKVFTVKPNDAEDSVEEIHVSSEEGAVIPVFDEVIDDMNRLQDDIIYGE